jgi:uncharacterized protein (DUF2147 family)
VQPTARLLFELTGRESPVVPHIRGKFSFRARTGSSFGGAVTLRAMRELHYLRGPWAAAASILMLVTGVLWTPVASANQTVDTDAKASRVEGVWASKGAVFAIERSGDTLQATVVALRKPRPDRKNAKAELRDRPLIGLQLLSDYRFKRGRWRGDFYDPGSGRTYSSYIRLDDEGNLRLRAWVLMFGHTEVMEPVGNCTERIIAMLEVSGVAGLCPP